MTTEYHKIPDGCSFILFDVRVGEWWLERKDVHDVARKLDIRTVPLIDIGPLSEAFAHVQSPQASWLTDDAMAEGLVMRPKVKAKDFPR